MAIAAGGAALLGLAPAAASTATGRSGGPGSSGGFSDLAPWLGILGLLVVISGVVLLRLRRGIRQDDGASSVGFTLHDVREMHARGELTDEEFQRARNALVDGVRRAAERASADRDSA